MVWVRHSAKRRSFEPKDVPRPPQVIARIIQEASNPEVSPRQLAQSISVDPSLTAEMLRAVNSGLYAPRSEITSITHAVMVLGGRALRNLATCFAVRDSIRTWRMRSCDVAGFWEASLRRAVAGQLIAQKLKLEDPTEAFTIGLLQDVGLGILFHSQRSAAKQWPRFHAALPHTRHALEREIFGTTHDEVAKILVELWELPANLAQPIIWHHSAQRELSEQQERATRICEAADYVAAVFAAEQGESAIHRVHALLGEGLGIDSEAIDSLLDQVSSHVTDTATDLGFRVREQPQYQNVVRSALRSLVNINLSYEQLVVELEQAIREKEKLTADLATANARLERLANIDSLTLLSNRRHYDGFLASHLADSEATKTPLCLLYIDIDHFKSVNDRYGHPVGDAVLRLCADTLQSCVRTSDLCARLGGEEFAVVLPDTPLDGARIVAERIRSRISEAVLALPETNLQVTASIGVSWTNGGTGVPTVQELGAAADECLYRSKTGGRNRVTLAS